MLQRYPKAPGLWNDGVAILREVLERGKLHVPDAGTPGPRQRG